MALLVQNALRHLKVKYKDVNQNGNNVECKYEKHRLLRKNLRVQSRKSISKICFFFAFCFLVLMFTKNLV